MKKNIIAFLLLSFGLVSCYDDYIEDFAYSTVYIPQQLDVRTFVVGEGMKIKVGAELGGVRENSRNRNVNFKIDEALITPEILTAMQASSYNYIKSEVASLESLTLLPSNYYSLSNGSTIVIEKGQHTGTIEVKADSAAFLADAKTLQANYVLPFFVTNADADSILEEKRYAVIALRYENMLFGNYLHGGVTTVKDASGATIETIRYYTTPTQGNTELWQLSTVAPHALVSNGYSNTTSANKAELQLSLEGTQITIGTAPGATYTYLPDGESTYNGAKLLQDRKIFLNYKYVNADGNTCFAQDTLTFRNRIRDGVNEWQDENPDHYK